MCMHSQLHRNPCTCTHTHTHTLSPETCHHISVHSCSYALAHSHLHVDRRASSCTEIDMCSSAHTDAHTHTHTRTLTPHTLTCSPAKTPGYTNPCTDTHRQALVHTHTGTHSLSHGHLQMRTQGQTHRHKCPLRHRQVHMHMRKHSLSPHSENQDSTRQLSASVPLTTPGKSLEAQCSEGKSDTGHRWWI